MSRYLIDIVTKKNSILVSELIRPVEDQEDQDEINRFVWQADNAHRDVILSDLIAIGVYTKQMEDLPDKYVDGVAIYSGEDLIEKIDKFISTVAEKGSTFVGWEIKNFIIPSIYRALLMDGYSLEYADSVFNLYPFENKKTLDLANVYNHNGQMRTVRSRNMYDLEEIAFSYGYSGALTIPKDEEPEETLRRRIKLQKYLFELRGYSWQNK